MCEEGCSWGVAPLKFATMNPALTSPPTPRATAAVGRHCQYQSLQPQGLS